MAIPKNLLAAFASILAVGVAAFISLMAGPVSKGSEPAVLPAAHERIPARDEGRVAAPEHFTAGGDYMPLTAGRSLTYRMGNGERFTITFGPRRQIHWFDDRLLEVVAVFDSRCHCQLFYAEQEGQVRAVGAMDGEHLARWGEYVVIFPGAGAGRHEPVETPAGRFERALRVETLEGITWFAPGVGIVKTEGYALVDADVAY